MYAALAALALAPSPAAADFKGVWNSLAGDAHPTPTPSAPPPAPCPAPWPALFKLQPKAMLIPSTPYEDGAVEEPFVLPIHGLYHMTYSAGGWHGMETVALATAKSPLGPWQKHGVIVGGGHAGVAGAASMSTQLKVGSEYRLYYRSGGDSSYSYVSSKDGFKYSSPQVAISAGIFNTTDYCHGVQYIDSCGIAFDPACSCYQMTAEVATGHCKGYPSYVLWYFKSVDGAKTFQPQSNVPLASISRGVEKISVQYAGTRALTKTADTWVTWPHSNRSIYFASSPDLYNWTPATEKVLTPGPGLIGVTHCNQVADASVLAADGKLFLYFSAVDNTETERKNVCRIGVMVMPGSVADLMACRTPKAGT